MKDNEIFWQSIHDKVLQSEVKTMIPTIFFIPDQRFQWFIVIIETWKKIWII